MKLTAKRQYLHQAITSLAWEVSRDKELENEIIEFCIKNAKMPKKHNRIPQASFERRVKKVFLRKFQTRKSFNGRLKNY